MRPLGLGLFRVQEQFVCGWIGEDERRVLQSLVHFIFEIADFASRLRRVVIEVFPEELVERGVRDAVCLVS